MVNSPITKNAFLNWNEQGTPVSREFDDVYFSNENGLEETRYVFLTGNSLPERFYSHQKRKFTIAETGFGTGLNFLTVWQSFRQFIRQQPDSIVHSLHFISFEKFPLKIDDLVTAHRSWPELAELAELLHKQWPLACSGCHRLFFDNNTITLDLWFGDINQTLPQLDHSFNNNIDCWFLDGFAPSKNPDMWNSNVFEKVFSLTKNNGTFATFTAAGFVRRGLQRVGFDVQKIKGFGHKREMLAGSKPENSVPENALMPGYWQPTTANINDIAIIGGGIASAFTALALIKRGAKVTLYCQDITPASGASGNRQGVFYPLLNNDQLILSPFFIQAFTFARRQYDLLTEQGLAFSHDWCGVAQLGYDEKTKGKLDRLSKDHYPKQLIYSASREELNKKCGLQVHHSGVIYPLGGWLCPAELTNVILATVEQLGGKILYQHKLTELKQTAEKWQLDFESKTSLQHQMVILANGHQLIDFDQTKHLPLYSVRGQVSHIPTTPQLSQLKQVLCYDGYFTPVDKITRYHCLGASYVSGSLSTDYSLNEQQQNLSHLINCLPEANWVKDINISENLARSSIRCSVRDHLPMVGNVPNYDEFVSAQSSYPQRTTLRPFVWNNLFMIGALGSRGLCTAPLLAEILASQIYHEPQPVNNQILNALNPARMWIRKQQKQSKFG